MNRRLMTLIELLISMALASALLIGLTFFYQNLHTIDRAAEELQNTNFQLRYAENRLSRVLTEVYDDYQTKGEPFFFTRENTGGFSGSSLPSLLFMFDNKVSMDTERSNAVLGYIYVDSNANLCLATWPSPYRKQAWQNVDEMKKEVLLENVENLEFEFYIPPDKDRSLVKKSLSYQGKQKEEKKEEESEGDDKKPAEKPGKKGTGKKELPAASEEKKEQPAVNPEQEVSSGLEPGPPDSWVKTWKKEYKSIPTMLRMHIKLKRKASPNGEQSIVFAFHLPNSKRVIVYEG